jgi:hypothetical protein
MWGQSIDPPVIVVCRLHGLKAPVKLVHYSGNRPLSYAFCSVLRLEIHATFDGHLRLIALAALIFSGRQGATGGLFHLNVLFTLSLCYITEGNQNVV